MKPNEVRIDNWVMGYLDKKPVKVDWLVIKHLWDGNIQSVYDPKPVYEPIPLTPEILERCGFEKRIINNAFNEYFLPCTPAGYKNEWILRYRDYPNNNGIEFAPTLDGNIHSFPCKYLHQLQNLYFALTGEELNYQP